MKKRVLVCFDFEKDRSYKYLMNAWNANDNFEFSFNDVTPDEIQSESISVIKANLTKKIMQADITLVLIGKDCNKIHPDYREIGYRNWQIFEIERSKYYGNKLIAVKLGLYNESPSELYGVGAYWVYSFNQDDIVNAINSV